MRKYNHFPQPKYSKLHSLQLELPLSHNLTTVCFPTQKLCRRKRTYWSRINTEWEWKNIMHRWNLLIDFPWSFGEAWSATILINYISHNFEINVKAGGLSWIFIIHPLILQMASNSLCFSQVSTPVGLTMHAYTGHTKLQKDVMCAHSHRLRYSMLHAWIFCVCVWISRFSRTVMYRTSFWQIIQPLKLKNEPNSHL